MAFQQLCRYDGQFWSDCEPSSSRDFCHDFPFGLQPFPDFDRRFCPPGFPIPVPLPRHLPSHGNRNQRHYYAWAGRSGSTPINLDVTVNCPSSRPRGSGNDRRRRHDSSDEGSREWRLCFSNKPKKKYNEVIYMRRSRDTARGDDSDSEDSSSEDEGRGGNRREKRRGACQEIMSTLIDAAFRKCNTTKSDKNTVKNGNSTTDNKNTVHFVPHDSTQHYIVHVYLPSAECKNVVVTWHPGTPNGTVTVTGVVNRLSSRVSFVADYTITRKLEAEAKQARPQAAFEDVIVIKPQANTEGLEVAVPKQEWAWGQKQSKVATWLV